jgi:hypothetical protein
MGPATNGLNRLKFGLCIVLHRLGTDLAAQAVRRDVRGSLSSRLDRSPRPPKLPPGRFL